MGTKTIKPHRVTQSYRMKTCIKCKNIKDLNDFNKDKSRVDGKTVWCKSCTKESKKKYDLNNKEKNTEYRNSRKEIKAEYDSSYREKNIVKLRLYEIERREKKSLYNAQYARTNPGKMNARTAKRIASKIQATPKWLNRNQLVEIEEIYHEANRLTKETGISHEVDHIVPLQGKNVRGLHVPWNLQILTKSENIAKSNIFNQ